MNDNLVNSNLPLTWSGPSGVNLPANVHTADVILSYAKSLTSKQQTHVIKAFQDQAYDMGAEYIWRRSMIRLRSSLETLGMKFIGEMLGREDIDEFSSIETVLTDYNTIVLAEHLGVINSTGALKLKQALELVTHYLSENAEKEQEEITLIDGILIISTCVKYILGEQDISIALEFSNLRKRLLSESLKIDDIQIEQLLSSPIFYLRTVLSILLTAIKNDQGAKLDHAIGNLNLIVDAIWNKLSEKDKWAIGSAYRDVTAAGNLTAAKGLKNALLKVGGFDYVPENLRSITYTKAAKALLEAHFGMNNFYTEPALVKQLANLGSTIPGPAFIDCLQAYLCVYLGNSWNIAWNATPTAEKQLKAIQIDKWRYYFQKVIHNDDIILAKLMETKPANRFADFIIETQLSDLEDLPGTNQKLLEALSKKKIDAVQRLALSMYNKLKTSGKSK